MHLNSYNLTITCLMFWGIVLNLPTIFKENTVYQANIFVERLWFKIVK